MRIGLDFDNTIICYDDVFLSAAKRKGLLADSFVGNKQDIRDTIRLLPDGETEWQRLQGIVYGRGVADALMFDGVGNFLQRCCESRVPVVIVSHKTEFGHFDPDRLNLRDAAREWMRAQGFFDRFGLSEQNVFFETTRSEKIARIATLGFTHFVDDLEEVLTDPDFPEGVSRILFSESDPRPGEGSMLAFRSWRDIENYVFASV